MGKIRASVYITLDGVVQKPEKWSLAYFDDDANAYAHRLLFGSAGLLLGRATYEIFAGSWPGRTDDTGFSDRMNSLPKYVVTSSSEPTAWSNSSTISGDVVTEIAKLKDSVDGDLLVYGSGTLVVDTLLAHGLLDELHLWVVPVVAGTSDGRPLFEAAVPTSFSLLSATQFASGTVVLAYDTAVSR